MHTVAQIRRCFGIAYDFPLTESRAGNEVLSSGHRLVCLTCANDAPDFDSAQGVRDSSESGIR